MDRYEEALEKARAEYEKASEQGYTWLMNLLEGMFPQLKESEDERVREAIEGAIRVYGKTQGEWIGGYDMDTLVFHLREAFGALEKQKEQKPFNVCEQCPYYKDCPDYNEQKPAEWSEEDKEMVRRAIFYTEQYRTNYGDTKESEECFNWLLDLHRNIRPPFHWKPSREQMGMLLAVINDPNNAGAESCHLMLQSLYADLEKL